MLTWMAAGIIANIQEKWMYNTGVRPSYRGHPGSDEV